ncbi:MAG: DUF3987 domain-containing protein [Bacteroidales bacterium]|nr:DUF3987 domain-containing protein [Bacteroidales bacterium]
MTKNKFNPQDWLNNQSLPPNNIDPIINYQFSSVNSNDIENVVSRIEASAIDIAPTYADWRDLGFALADALGENGRGYYQRLSRFYPNYTADETDKQFSACLKAHGHGITIKTLFHLAKQAGISICGNASGSLAKSQNSPKSPISPAEEIEDIEDMPTFSQDIKDTLPSLLAQIVSRANSPEDADLLLLGSLTVFSACLPNVFGNYGGREVFPNLFLFVTAQASAGKGRLTLCRHLVQPIHDSLKQLYAAEMEEYKRLQNEYALDKKNNEPPQEPPLKTLLIPANSSATSVYQVLNDNQGVGLMFETEGDTLANTFKSDYGNFSDGFRKAFHHEMISYTRRKDREFVELAKPRLSALLSGTPRQILSLIPDAENGLFSRFIFYYMNVRLEWLNVFADNEETLDQYFEHLGKQFYELYRILQASQPIRFALSARQQEQFNSFFAQVQKEYSNLFGLDIVASVRRLGLITFRIAMILTSLRIIDGGQISNLIVCDDSDFQSSIIMARVLLQHTAKVFGSLPTTESNAPNGQTVIRQTFLDNLPPEFDRKTYLAVAEKLKIPAKTAEKYISKFCVGGLLKHLAHDSYGKP